MYGPSDGFRVLWDLELFRRRLASAYVLRPPELRSSNLSRAVYRGRLRGQRQLRLQVDIQTAGYNVDYGFIYSGPWLFPGYKSLNANLRLFFQPGFLSEILMPKIFVVYRGNVF